VSEYSTFLTVRCLLNNKVHAVFCPVPGTLGGGIECWGQGHSQEFATGDKRGVLDSGGQKSPAGSRDRAPVGSVAKPPEAGDKC